MKRKLKYIVSALMLAASAALWSACRDEMEGKLFLISDDLMMDDYITQKDEDMSSFLDVVDKAGYRGMVHAYGTYTFFVPSNQAIAEYLQSKGISSVADLTAEECEAMVLYHVVREEFASSDTGNVSTFIDGRLGVPTMLNKYLTTRTVQQDGIAVIQVNRVANILRADIRVANGYIHKISKVLVPPPFNCGAQVKELRDKGYGLFADFMQQSGWLDSLNQDGWYTVFMQSDEALASVGITCLDSLIDYMKIESRYNLTDSSDAALLRTYAAYHCVSGLFYLADLSKTSTLQTKAKNQSINIKTVRDTLLLNEYGNPEDGPRYEPGIKVLKKSEYSDYSCANGVLIDVGGYIGPKIRGAQAVYWDVAEQPEIVKNSKFRKSGFGVSWDDLKEFSDIKISLASGIRTYGEFAYNFYASFNSGWQLVNHDALQIRWYRMSSLEFTLPLLTPGTYNVWVAYRAAPVTGNRVRATFVEAGEEEQQMNTISFADYINTSDDSEVLLARGWRRYVAKQRSNTMSCQRWGTCKIMSTGRHTLRCDVIERGRNADIYMDMILFIPIEEDQIWPRWDMNGKAIYKPTITGETPDELLASEEEACAQIWPYTEACSSDNYNK